ncbi:MAG: CHAT domain-containing tetratricopeptide repeat protein [Bacteroidota bacterium]
MQYWVIAVFFSFVLSSKFSQAQNLRELPALTNAQNAPEFGEQAQQMAIEAFRSRLPVDAHAYLQSGIDQLTQFQQEALPIYAELHHTQGSIFFFQQDFPEALRFYRMYKRLLGTHHPEARESHLKSFKNLALCHRKMGVADSATFYADQILTKADRNQDSTLCYQAYWLKAELAYATQAFEISLKTGENARKYLSRGAKQLPETYRLTGNCLKHLGRLTEALRHKELALKGFEQTQASIVKQTIARFDLGEIHQYRNQFDLAVPYYLQSLETFEALYRRKPQAKIAEYLATVTRNLGRLYEVEGDYEVAGNYYLRALEILEQHDGLEAIDLATIYRLLARNRLNLGRLDAALLLARQSLQWYDLIESKVSLGAGTAYLLIGKIYLEQQAFSSAQQVLDSAWSIFEQLRPDCHADLVQVLLAKGELALAQTQFETAQSWGNQSINCLGNPEKVDIASISQPQVLWEALRLSATIWATQADYPDTSDPQAAQEQALIRLKQVINLENQLRQAAEGARTRQWLGKKASPVFEAAISTALDLYAVTQNPAFLEDAFVLSEQSRAARLQERLQDHSARKFAGIPEQLLLEEQQVREQIAYYQKRIREGELTYASSMNALRDGLLVAQQKGRDLLQQLERQYPAYFQLKYQQPDLSIASIQEQLSENTRLVEFFQGEQALFTFVITRDSAWTLVSDIPDSFTHQVFGLQQAIVNKDPVAQPLEAWNALVTPAHHLYQLLMAPVLKDALPGEHLLIIPSGVLAYLPFEVLLQSAADPDVGSYGKLDYLIKSHPIQYGYSATHLLNYQTERVPPNSYLGIAPNFSADTTYTNLKFAQKEIDAAADMMNGKTLTDVAATEKAFLSVANNFQVLHLATHGLVDESEPLDSRIVFQQAADSDGLLHVYELYNLRLQAQLVMLSACNTGIGKYEEGEGVVSLSRAFAYAGCPSILMTLWSVNDRSSAQIVDTYVQELANQVPKDQALQHAKIEYLKASDDLLAHPFFWAGFVGVGSSDPLEVPDSSIWWRIGLMVIILSLGLVLKRYFSKRKK